MPRDKNRDRNLNAGKSGNHRKYGPGTNGPVGCGLEVVMVVAGVGYGISEAVKAVFS